MRAEVGNDLWRAPQSTRNPRCDAILGQTPSPRFSAHPPAQEPDASAFRLISKDLAAIEHRATQALEIATQNNWLLDIALDHLTLGRVSLLRAVLDSPAQYLPQARTALDTALATLRQANSRRHMPSALLPSAWLHALSGDWAMSLQRLNEAFALAIRGGNPDAQWQGGMRLYLIDTLLHRVRLFGRQKAEGRRQKAEGRRLKEYPWPDRTPEQDLAEAANLIEITGYHRRDEEVKDLSLVIGQ